MKALLNTSKSEKQANKLWAGFRRKDQQGFWVNYEELLRQAQTSGQHQEIKEPLAKPIPQKVSKQNTVKPMTFHISVYKYIGYGLVTLYGLAVAINPLIQGINFSSIPFILISLGLLAGVVYLSSFIHSFSVTQKGFYIHRLWQKNIAFRWDKLREIKVVKEFRYNELVICTQDFDISTYRYELSEANHRRLFKILRKKVSNVDDSQYQ